MSFTRPTRIELSRHEAGHAYAFAALVRSSKLEELALGKTDEGNHHGWCRRRTILHRSGSKISTQDPPVQPDLRWRAAAEVVVALAGPVAEFRHRHRSRAGGFIMLGANVNRLLQPGFVDTDGDFERIRTTLAYADPPKPERAFQALLEVADEIVAQNWPRIQHLARLLLDRNVLGSVELATHFEGHPARQYSRNLPLG